MILNVIKKIYDLYIVFLDLEVKMTINIIKKQRI